MLLTEREPFSGLLECRETRDVLLCLPRVFAARHSDQLSYTLRWSFLRLLSIAILLLLIPIKQKSRPLVRCWRPSTASAARDPSALPVVLIPAEGYVITLKVQMQTRELPQAFPILAPARPGALLLHPTPQTSGRQCCLRAAESLISELATDS